MASSVPVSPTGSVHPPGPVSPSPLLQTDAFDNPQQHTFATLVEAFEKQADFRSDAIAVICQDEHISFAELNRRANRLAHVLIGYVVRHHCGASVNLLLPYAPLRDANVGSTAQLLRMALTGKKNRKAFHYVSTLSALSFPYPTPLDHPKATITKNSPLHGFDGYILNKRVSEALISHTEELVPDLPIAIYRTGSIFGHSKTGHVNINALIHKLLCGIVQNGAYPTDRDYLFLWAPVDYYSKVIVHISKTGGSMTSTRRYNVRNPCSIPLPSARLGEYISSFGYNMIPKQGSVWSRDLMQAMDDAPGTNIFEPFKDSMSHETEEAPTLYDMQDTLDSLRLHPRDPDSPLLYDCGPISESHIHAVLRFCIEKGYIPSPTLQNA